MKGKKMQLCRHRFLARTFLFLSLPLSLSLYHFCCCSNSGKFRLMAAPWNLSKYPIAFSRVWPLFWRIANDIISVVLVSVSLVCSICLSYVSVSVSIEIQRYLTVLKKVVYLCYIKLPLSNYLYFRSVNCFSPLL